MDWLNIPNSLTLLRIFLVPVFTYFFLKGHFREALIFFILAGFSDFLDGFIARLFKKKTALGAILDPAADKFLITVSFIALTLNGILPLWLTCVVVFRDLYIVLGLAILKRLGGRLLFKPTFLSKTNTFCQLVLGLLSFLLVYFQSQSSPWDFPFLPHMVRLHLIFIFVVTGMTIGSGLQYTMIGIKILSGRSDYADFSIKKN
jgi:cardiolipin synthase